MEKSGYGGISFGMSPGYTAKDLSKVFMMFKRAFKMSYVSLEAYTDLQESGSAYTGRKFVIYFKNGRS